MYFTGAWVVIYWDNCNPLHASIFGAYLVLMHIVKFILNEEKVKHVSMEFRHW